MAAFGGRLDGISLAPRLHGKTCSRSAVRPRRSGANRRLSSDWPPQAASGVGRRCRFRLPAGLLPHIAWPQSPSAERCPFIRACSSTRLNSALSVRLDYGSAHPPFALRGARHVRCVFCKPPVQGRHRCPRQRHRQHRNLPARQACWYSRCVHHVETSRVGPRRGPGLLRSLLRRMRFTCSPDVPGAVLGRGRGAPEGEVRIDNQLLGGGRPCTVPGSQHIRKNVNPLRLQHPESNLERLPFQQVQKMVSVTPYLSTGSCVLRNP